MKNTEKNNAPPQSDLLDVDKAAKPISTDFASAVQLSTLLPFAQIDETFLRNRARELNPRTGQPWIPRPSHNQFPITPTILGLLEWFHAKAAEKDGLPSHYASMQAMENALRLSRKSIKWLLKNGAAEAQHDSNRIEPRIILARADQIISALADGAITGIEGLEQWNKDTELAKKLRLESQSLEDDQKFRRGEMLMSRDATFAITELVADELIWEKRDQPLRAALLNVPKTINRQHRTILTGNDPMPDKIRQCAAVVTTSVAAVLNKLRAKIPKRIADANDAK